MTELNTSVPAGGATIAFGDVQSGGTSADMVLKIKNIGGDTLTLTSCSLGGTNPTSFSATACPGTLAAGAEVVLLPRAEDAALTAAIELTVLAGSDGNEVPMADVNVYRDGTWIGTTSGAWARGLRTLVSSAK